MKKKKVLLLLIAVFALAGFFFLRPKKISSQIYPSLTSASATLSNSRLSFYGVLDVGVSAGATTIVLDTTGIWADESTSHLFPNDTVSVGPNNNFTVGGIINATTFFLVDGLTVGADADATIYATQSGTLTVSVTTVSDIPANGDIIVTIPDPPAGEGNDKAPDSTSSISTNGFDFNKITTANITCPSGWNAESATAPDDGTGHTVVCNTSVGTTGPTALEVIIGVGGTGLINPAPVNVGHTAGVADIYTINVKTRDASNNTKDEVDIKVAPVEAVLVSATVDETLSFTVAGRGAGTTSCGKGAAVGVVSTATSIPWAVLSAANTFYDIAQQLTVSTNADAGYAVTIEENDQMGKNGGACSGADAGEALNCIKDTTCDGTCDEDEEDDWETAANNGLGFSLEDVSGGDVAFEYNVVSGGCEGVADTDFCARQIADMAASETKANILSETAPVSGASAYVCYRISISPTQPAGYYYNKVKYTCTAVF